MSAKDFEGPGLSKPEWFSIVEADTRVKHTSGDHGSFRVLALAGLLLLTSTGLLFVSDFTLPMILLRR